MRNYSFTISDHLGNIRLVVDAQGQVQQKNEYTAFGVVQSTDPSKNNYLFNNKELQTGTNYLDYGARMYQPELGRWNVVDPLGEKREWLTPYNFVQNNPLNRFDPNGKLDWPVFGELYKKASEFIKNTEFKLSISGTVGFQANLKVANVVEAEVNAYSVKIFESGVSIKNSKIQGHSQIMNSKISSEKVGDTKNAPIETKAAIGAKVLGVGLALETTRDNDNLGNKSNEKVDVKVSGNKGSFGSTYIYENTSGKSSEKVENSYSIGGAFLLGVELKLDLTKTREEKK